MTFVAAQKGWDGVAMTILMIIAWTSSWQFGNDYQSKYWLNIHGIVVEAKSFRYFGRTHMIGAIQAFSGTKVTSWMDSILAPGPRRNAFLSRLDRLRNGGSTERQSPEALQAVDDEDDGDEKVLSSFDKDWVVLQVNLAMQAARVMKYEMESHHSV